ncbi:MAG: DUF58 domain-containing protein [Planctomycetaceae bacterium]|nr:DUF58 domain-containing protein [Planctomycetaceae bacterium]
MKDIADILKSVRKIEIVANRAVNELFSGQYRSVFRGRGMEFNEVREYEAGDDIRSIDWNVTARAGRPFIKRFVEERELTVLFAVDTSASGMFGCNRSKVETAIEVAATLMFSAMKNNDKVGLLTFASGIGSYFQPRKGRANVLHLIRELISCEPEVSPSDTVSSTNITAALDYLNRVVRQRAIIFLLSDLFVTDLIGVDSDEPDIAVWHHPDNNRMLNAIIRQYNSVLTPTQRSLSITTRRHDLVALMLSDRRETEFPNVGMITLRDAESGELVTVDTGSRKVREWLGRQFESVRRHIGKSLQQTRTEILTIDTDGDFVKSLRKFFVKREGKR